MVLISRQLMHLIARGFFIITVMSIISIIVVVLAIEDCSMVLAVILIEFVLIVRPLVLLNLAGAL